LTVSFFLGPQDRLVFQSIENFHESPLSVIGLREIRDVFFPFPFFMAFKAIY